MQHGEITDTATMSLTPRDQASDSKCLWQHPRTPPVTVKKPSYRPDGLTLVVILRPSTAASCGTLALRKTINRWTGAIH